MRIGIDISQIVYQTGVSNYTKNLVSKILEIDKNNEYVLFGGSLRRVRDFRVFRDFGGTKIYPFPPTLADFVWNKLHILPIEMFIGKIDVFQTSDWTMPPAKAKIIAPIYDMVVYKYPETSHPSIVATQKRRIEWVKKEADIIVTISESSRHDINEILNIPLEKIRVVYPAVADEFLRYKKQDTRNKHYFLAVGTREPRKNFNRLIEAFKKANIKDTELWIVGKSGWEELPKVNGVKFLGFVDQKEMPELYANAKAFVYPSLYEGFGIPILEAMACGCPVITSNVSSMPEAGGEAATYIDPLNIDSIVDALRNYKNNKNIFEQVNKFTWEKSAREMIKIYEELYSSR